MSVYNKMSYIRLQKIAYERGLYSYIDTSYDSKTYANRLILTEKLIEYDKKIGLFQTPDETQIIAERQYTYWKMYNMIPEGVNTNKYMCKYLISGQDHEESGDGYCTDAENVPFEPFFLFKKITPTDNLSKLSYKTEGCGGISVCYGEAYTNYEAIEIIPFCNKLSSGSEFFRHNKYYILDEGPSLFKMNKAASIIQRWVLRWLYRPDSKYVQKILKNLQNRVGQNGQENTELARDVIQEKINIGFMELSGNDSMHIKDLFKKKKNFKKSSKLS